jgi:glycosyltransferase involved in cell wall biosynthesis
MRIVHLESGRHLYGGARQVASLLNALTDFDNVLVCRPEAEIAQQIATHVRIVQMPLHGDLDVGAKARLRRVLAEQRADLLHVHSRAGADRIGGRVARSLGVRAVLTRRVDNVEPRLWARHKFGSYDAIAAISTPIAQWLRRDVRVPAQRVTRIASGVDTAVLADRATARANLAARYRIDLSQPVIAAAGQLIERKGHDVLLDALPSVIARHRGLRLILFGRGPRGAALEGRARRLGIASNVIFAGFVPGLRDLLAGFDVFVHPARNEGLGLVVLEAMAAGVPVVASRAGGLIDAVSAEHTGLLVPPGDAGALTAALLRMLEHADLRERLAGAARERVAQEFTVQAMAAAYRRLYVSLAAQ